MELHAQIACSMPRELTKRGVKWQARAVYTEAVLYCRENLTDAIIHRNALGYWMPDMPVKQRAALLDALVATGALLAHDEGWAFPEHVWRAIAPGRREFNRRRWHVYCRRSEIFDRDGHACVYCGATDRLEVDHIIPMAKGGTDESHNLQTLCKPCNSGKRDR